MSQRWPKLTAAAAALCLLPARAPHGGLVIVLALGAIAIAGALLMSRPRPAASRRG
ncbi:MAG TPA: hypothetical protein VIX82_08425 [Solirubrobacteraceae bacterium]